MGRLNMDAARYFDILSRPRFCHIRSLLCVEKPWNTTACAITGIRTRSNSQIASISSGRGSCSIASCGRMFLVPFLMGLMSTTRTAIRATTSLRTLSCFLGQIMASSIAVNAALQSGHTSTASALLPRHGTARTKALPGTESTERNRGMTEPRLIAPVSIAASPIRRWAGLAQSDFAPMRASRIGDARAAQTTSWSYVLCAVTNSPRIAMRARRHAPGCVDRLRGVSFGSSGGMA